MTGYGDLSDDLMIETLSRLPVKSLLRFKSVCKSWYGLVKDPNFIYRHLKRDDNMRLMVYCTYKNPDDTDPLDDLITYLSIFPDGTLRDLYFQDLEPVMNGYKNGPYDGIFVLLRNATHINLWNVSMNEYRVVPECTVHLPCGTRDYSTDYGLGLDPLTNDLKLVLIISSRDKDRRWTPDFSPAAVYNFTTNCWRDLGSFPVSHEYRFDGSDDVYLNGFCYWVVSLPDYSKEILSFSMSGEMFQLIKGPNILQLQRDILSTRTWLLGIYDDCLSLLYSKKFVHSFDLWIMKGGSWTIHSSFGPFIETYRPIGFWKKGEFFLESSETRLVLYDSEHEEMRDLKITGLWFSVSILKESLITVSKEYT